MSNDEQMDEQLRRFLDWQAGQLDGTRDAHGMALRIGSRSASRKVDRRRLVWAVVALALVAALAAAGAVGSRLIERPPIAGLLAYSMNGDIYLADQDGANPRKVIAGVPWDAGGGPSYVLGDAGPSVPWAPDGRHFLFFDLQEADPQLTGHIADASGHVVASIPNIWVDATWSPDSTRIEAWTGGSVLSQISIFGIDGALQESLPLPTGYVRAREYPGFWAPDGGSVYVRLSQGAGPTPGYWQLSIDGSTPRHLAADDPLSSTDSMFTHDGSRLAFVSDTSLSPTLFVANADGTDPRVLVVGQTAIGPSVPRWSPDDQRIAYRWSRSTLGTTVDSELRIVDVASGSVRTVVAAGAGDITPVGWSPAGDELLYMTWDQAGRSALWTMNVDGTHSTLVAGAESGYWQPVQTPKVDRAPASVSPTAEPSPTSPAASLLAPTLPPFTRSDQGFLLDEQTGMAVTGHLDPGTYTYTNVDAQGSNVRFTVPAGWTWYGRYLSKGGVGPPGGAAIFFVGGPVQVYGDPCHWAGSPSNPPTGPSVNDLMAALVAQPLRGATTPIERNASVPDLNSAVPSSVPDRWPGMAVELTVPNDLHLGGCDQGQFRSWGPDDVVRAHQGPGQHDLVWAIDLTGNGVASGHGYLIIDAASFSGTPADVMSEVEAILASISAGHWG